MGAWRRVPAQVAAETMNGREGSIGAVSENIQCYGANRMAADPTQAREPSPAVWAVISAYVQACTHIHTHARTHTPSDTMLYVCITQKTLYAITS